MKKLLAIAMVLVLFVTVAGCSAATTNKTGLGTVISIAKSASASVDATGKAVAALAEVDTTIASVTIDSKGKIVKTIIDVAQQKVNFDATGKVTTDLKAVQQTKIEKGDKYGLKAQSKLGKEWYEQANAFATWTIGKTIAEVKALKVKPATDADPGAPDIAELTSSVSIGVSEIIQAMEKAVAAAK